MKTLKSIISSSVTWSFADGAYVLKSNDDVLVKLIPERSSRAYFEIDGEDFTIHNEGFWNVKTVIKQLRDQIMTVKRNAAGSKGTIEFSGTKWNVRKTGNASLEQLSFIASDNSEVLKYNLTLRLKPKTILTAFEKLAGTKEFILLVVAGFFSFKRIINKKPAASEFAPGIRSHEALSSKEVA